MSIITFKFIVQCFGHLFLLKGIIPYTLVIFDLVLHKKLPSCKGDVFWGCELLVAHFYDD